MFYILRVEEVEDTDEEVNVLRERECALKNTFGT